MHAWTPLKTFSASFPPSSAYRMQWCTKWGNPDNPVISFNCPPGVLTCSDKEGDDFFFFKKSILNLAQYAQVWHKLKLQKKHLLLSSFWVHVEAEGDGDIGLLDIMLYLVTTDDGCFACLQTILLQNLYLNPQNAALTADGSHSKTAKSFRNR